MVCFDVKEHFQGKETSISFYLTYTLKTLSSLTPGSALDHVVVTEFSEGLVFSVRP